ncbi:nucleoside phosphorylase [bacterium]|nr:nucleoside phosphorylase [bacterium]MBU0899660.1 nucleoside phosphorylase [bacterium]MBU1152355.1 nucleoside phosphorylase [bacterium]
MIHLKCNSSDLGKYVLLPGDPKRAKYVALNFLKEAQLVSDYRGLDSYTGKYKDIRVSVVTTGMGCPSAAIVTEELIMLGATTLIRIGTCGAIQKEISTGSIIIPTGAIPLVGIINQYNLACFCPTPDFYVLKALVQSAKELDKETSLGLIATSDSFYNEMDQAKSWSSKNILGLEMECAGIFAIAYLKKIKAAAILAVTGNLLFHEQVLDNEATKKAIDDEIEVALRAIELLDLEG